MINTFLGLPRCAVFVVEDSGARCFYINYTTSMGQSLARLYEQWNDKPRAGALELVIVSVTPDIETLKLHCEYYRDQYMDKGWTELLPPGRGALKYKPRVVVAPDFSCMEVRLVTTRGDSDKVVGRFKTTAEAQEFVMVYYGSGNQYCLPVFATNSLTREYLLKKETRGLTIR
jgi:hypothetical protein